jgi:tRNA (guanine26-N2/guanine27-N2)-dimethyltransferase
VSFPFYSSINYDSKPLRNGWSFISENTTQLLVPSNTLSDKDPSKFPVFFNPAAKFNRDISIQIYKFFVNERKKREEISFIDTMAGSGIRGLRVANEISNFSKIVLNDFNYFSICVSKVNSILNNVYYKCKFFNKEICNFLSNLTTLEERATIIDIDPFGTPSPYLDCVLRSIQNGGLISVTATDTAVLCGVYPRVCYRKYYGNPLKTKYSSEIGIRLLISSIALVASRLDLSIIPIFSHGYRNYLRVYCKILKSNYSANKIQEKLGYVIHCFSCGNRSFVKSPYKIIDCNNCHGKVTIGGPLWISNTYDKEIISNILSNLNDKKFNNKKFTNNSFKEFFAIALNEIDEYPYHYINDEIGKALKKNVVSVSAIVENLIKNGYRASKTIFAPNGFKTDATIMDIKQLFSCQIL